LREDNRAIVRAASQASKAADYLLGFVPDVAGSADSFVGDSKAMVDGSLGRVMQPRVLESKSEGIVFSGTEGRYEASSGRLLNGCA